MSGARGDGEAPSAQTRPSPFKPGGHDKGDISDAPFSIPLAPLGCTDTTLVKRLSIF